MPRFFFHSEGVSRFQDNEGLELDESQLAAEAFEFLAETIRRRSREFWASPVFRVVVTNEEGFIVYALNLSGFEAPALKGWREAGEVKSS